MFDAYFSAEKAIDTFVGEKESFPPEPPFFSVGMLDQSVPFYLQRTVTQVETKGELADGIAAEPEKFIERISDFEAKWRALDEAYAVMSPKTFRELGATGLPMTVMVVDPRRVFVARGHWPPVEVKAPVSAVSAAALVQALPRLARNLDSAATRPGAHHALGVAALLPEAVDEHGGDGQLVDQLGALFVAVDPLGEIVVAVAERERLDREDPVARIGGIEQRLPLVVAQLHARHVAFAPRRAFGRHAIVAARLLFRQVQGAA